MSVRRLVALSVLLVAVLGGTPAIAAPAAPPTEHAATSPEMTPRSPDPWFGVLELDERRAGSLVAAGLRTTVLPLAWDRWEPTDGRTDETYVRSVRERFGALREAGLDVVLDPGVQYPPSWVWSLPDAAMVDQHGRTHRGGTGADVPDVVFDPAVRGEVGEYVADLGRRLGDLGPEAVRIGGGPYNELRFPEPTLPGNDSWWAFGAAAQRASPVPGWRPGDVDPDGSSAPAFLRWYTGSLTEYLVWQVRTYRAAFGPAVPLHVLQPSWGVRPGEQEEAAARGLDGSTRGEARQTLQQGLDWAGQVRALERSPSPGPVVLWSTWLDARSQGTDPAYEAPVEHLSRLAAGQCRPLALGGENTGSGSVADMRHAVGRVRDLGLVGMLWMREPDLHDGAHASLDDYRSLVAPPPG